MYPARTRNLWLATSASAGASRRVGINSFDQRCIYQTTSVIKRISYCNKAGFRVVAGAEMEFRTGECWILSWQMKSQTARPESHPATPELPQRKLYAAASRAQ